MLVRAKSMQYTRCFRKRLKKDAENIFMCSSIQNVVRLVRTHCGAYSFFSQAL